MNAPLTHDKGVVDGEAVDVVDAACLDGFVIFLVTGKVSGRACWREGAG